MTDAPSEAAPVEGAIDPPKAGLSPGVRLILVAALFVGLFVIAKVTGVAERVSVEGLREWMTAAGWLGVLGFVVVFLVGELLQVPGLIFVAAAVLCYGQVNGGALSYVTAILSVMFSFAVVRGLGGKALGELDKPWIKKVMARLDERPVTTIAILRVVLIMSPPLNYALALSSVSWRAYLLGSVLGLVPPILGFVIFFDQAMSWLDIK